MKNLKWTRKKNTYALFTVNTSIQQLQSTCIIGLVEAKWIIVQQENNKITQKKKKKYFNNQKLQSCTSVSVVFLWVELVKLSLDDLGPANGNSTHNNLVAWLPAQDSKAIINQYDILWINSTSTVWLLQYENENRSESLKVLTKKTLIIW